MSSKCPTCDAPLEVHDDVMASEIIDCAGCSSEIEVLTLEPLLLGPAPDVEEDWGE